MLKNREEFILRETAGDFYLLHLCDGTQYEKPIRLNETGAFIIGELIKGISAKDIAKNISLEYGISVEDVESDIASLIDTMPECFRYESV